MPCFANVFCKTWKLSIRLVGLTFLLTNCFLTNLLHIVAATKYYGPLHTQHLTQYALATLNSFWSNICILYWEQMMQCLTYAYMCKEGPIEHFFILETQHFFEVGFEPIILVHVSYLLYPFFLCCCHQHAFEVLCNISRRTKQYHV